MVPQQLLLLLQECPGLWQVPPRPAQHSWSMVVSSHISSVLEEGAPTHHGTNSQQLQRAVVTGCAIPNPVPLPSCWFLRPRKPWQRAAVPQRAGRAAAAAEHRALRGPGPGPERARLPRSPAAHEPPARPAGGRSPRSPAPATAASVETAAAASAGPGLALVPFPARSSSSRTEPAAESPRPRGREGPARFTPRCTRGVAGAGGTQCRWPGSSPGSSQV